MMRRQAVISAIAAFSTVVGASAAPAQPAPPTESGTTRVWMLDVGQGSCVYVECPDGQSALLIDRGSSREGKTPLATVASWVNARMSAMDQVSVVISHGDKDHYSLLAQLDEANVDRVFMGGVRGDYPGSATSPTSIAGWLQDVEDEGGDVEVYPANFFRAGDSRLHCGSARVDVLTASYMQENPTASVDSRKNADSAVIRLSYGGTAVVMAGDAEGVTQRAALDNAREHGLSLDTPSIVMGSHHGARTAGSNNPPWVEAFKPVVAAFSASLNVKYRHPQCEVVGRYALFARPTSGKFRVACGVGSKSTGRLVESTVVTTYGNGHVRFDLDSSGYAIRCQRSTPACDASLDNGPGL